MADSTLSDLTKNIAETNRKLDKLGDALQTLIEDARSNRAEDKLSDRAETETEETEDTRKSKEDIRQNEMLRAILRAQQAQFRAGETAGGGDDLEQRAGVLSLLFGSGAGLSLLFAGEAAVLALGALAISFNALADDASEADKNLSKFSHGFFAGITSLKLFFRFAGITTALKGVGLLIKGVFGGIGKAIAKIFSPVTRLIRAITDSPIFKAVIRGAVAVGTALRTFFRRITGMSSAWLRVVSKLGVLFKAIPLIGVVLLAFDFIAAGVKEFFAGGNFGEIVVASFKGLWDGIILAVTGLLELIGLGINWIFQQFGMEEIGTDVRDIFFALSGAITGIGDFVSDLVGDLLNLITTGDLTAFMVDMGERWTDIVNAVKFVWKGAIDFLDEHFPGVTDTIQEIFDDIIEVFQNIPDTIQRLKEGFDNFVNSITNSVDEALVFFGLKESTPPTGPTVQQRMVTSEIVQGRAINLEEARQGLSGIGAAVGSFAANMVGSNNTSNTVTSVTNMSAGSPMNPLNTSDPAF